MLHFLAIRYLVLRLLQLSTILHVFCEETERKDKSQLHTERVSPRWGSIHYDALYLNKFNNLRPSSTGGVAHEAPSIDWDPNLDRKYMDFETWVRTRSLRRPADSSPRTPSWSTALNAADKVERYLTEDGHRTWGWVIYRCTYDDDSEWKEFMDRIRFYIRKTLQFYNGLDMMESLNLTIFDDRSMFDGANKSAVRDHFKKWADTAPQLEQGTVPGYTNSQRYRYCLQFDSAALRSVIDAPPPPEDQLGNGFVNIIRSDWMPRTREEYLEELEGMQEGWTPEVFDSIEGCTEEDVGWMRISYTGLMVTWYCLFRGSGGEWDVEYRRPPQIGQT